MRGNRTILPSPEGMAARTVSRTVVREKMPASKRALDLACIFLALPVLVPAMALLAVLIKCVSRGPVLFRQDRIGHDGRRFTCLKYRTMKLNADTGVHPGAARARAVDAFDLVASLRVEPAQVQRRQDHRGR